MIVHPTRTAASRTRKKQELYQLVIAETDVRTAINVADEFIEMLRFWSKETMPLHLSETFIAYVAVAYARPFTQARGSLVHPLPAKWGKFSDPKLQRGHDKMIEYRHTLFAHSDPSDRILMIIPGGQSFLGQSISSEIGWAMNDKTISPASIVDFRNTCIDLKERLQERMSQLIDELYEGMDLPCTKFPVRFDDGL